jgi:hypothetical protein
MSYEFAEGFKIRDQSATHFLLFSIMGWIDIFSRQRYRDLIIESFQYCRQHKELQIGGITFSFAAVALYRQDLSVVLRLFLQLIVD